MIQNRSVVSVLQNTRAEWRFCHYRPGESMKPHRHDCAQFSLILTGRQREVTSKGEYDTAAFMMEFKPANFQHANEFSEHGALLLSINLFNAGEDDKEISFPRWRVRPAQAMRSEWDQLAREMSTREVPREERINDLTDDLLSAILVSDYEKRAGEPPPWLLRGRDAVVETDLEVAVIAADAGVHRVHFSRCFRRYFGISVSEYRRRTRLAKAAGEIVRGAGASTAAYAAGFADQSHMTRDMRRETGLTPAP